MFLLRWFLGLHMICKTYGFYMHHPLFSFKPAPGPRHKTTIFIISFVEVFRCAGNNCLNYTNDCIEKRRKQIGNRIRLDNSGSKVNNVEKGQNHRMPTLPPHLPLRVAKAGRNYLNEEIIPSSPLGEAGQSWAMPCSALASMWTPPINEVLN